MIGRGDGLGDGDGVTTATYSSTFEKSTGLVKSLKIAQKGEASASPTLNAQPEHSCRSGATAALPDNYGLIWTAGILLRTR
jgi:hypothetical protein